jgi:hypothetical protein
VIPPAVEQYLLFVGDNCPPSVAVRLRRLDWALLTKGKVEIEHVHELAQLIEENLARRGAL